MATRISPRDRGSEEEQDPLAPCFWIAPVALLLARTALWR